MDELLFTSAAVLDFLSNVEELKDKNIQLAENDTNVSITIGDVTYQINSSNATEISVDDDVVEEITDVTSEAYDELSAQGVNIQDSIEGGPIKSLLKTLMLGGLVKMTANMLKN